MSDSGKILVLSSFNELSFRLVCDLLEKECGVVVGTDSPKTWRRRMGRHQKNLCLVNVGSLELHDYEKVFAIQMRSEGEWIKRSLKILKNQDVRLVAAVSFFENNAPRGVSLKKINDLSGESEGKLKVLYFGEILGEGGVVEKLVDNAIRRKKIVLPLKDFPLYFSFVDEASRALCEAMFGDRFAGSTYFGYRISFWHFSHLIKREVPLCKMHYSDKQAPLKVLSPNFFWTRDFGVKELRRLLTMKKTKRKGGMTRGRVRPVSFVMLFLVWVLLTPFLMLFLSTALAFSSYDSLMNGKAAETAWKISYSKKLAELGRGGFDGFSKVPFLSDGLEVFYRVSDLTFSLGAMSGEALSLRADMAGFLDAVFGNCEDCDALLMSNEMYLKADKLYRDSLFVSGEVQSLGGAVEVMIPGLDKFSGYVDYLRGFREMLPGVPRILGGDRETSYALILFNENKIRPAGGVINSLLIVSFFEGKLVDYESYDPSFIDQNLRGVVEASDEFRKYMKMENMRFEDAAWETSYDAFSERVIWFLRKSLDRKVDGVVAINKGELRRIAKMAGVSDERFEKFIGSMVGLSGEEMLSLGGEIVEGVDRRGVQMYLGNVLGWSDAGRDFSSCNNCDGVSLALLETDLSDEGTSLFVHREGSLEVFVTEDRIKSKLSTQFGVGEDGKYKSYVRLAVPLGSRLVRATVSGVDVTRRVRVVENNGKVEYGILVDVFGTNNKNVVFEWDRSANLDFSRDGKFVVRWKKQSGITPYPVDVRVRFGDLSLTRRNFALYNTDLVSDFEKEIVF